MNFLRGIFLHIVEKNRRKWAFDAELINLRNIL